MSRSASRFRPGALAAAVLLMAVVGVAAPAAAAGPRSAPLIDGERPAPAPITVRVHVLLAPALTGDAAVRRSARGTTTRANALRDASTITAPAGGDPCTDRAWKPRPASPGFVRWIDGMSWSFNAKSTPSGLRKGPTERALQRAAANITGAHNDCGRPDRVSATTTYQGRTVRRAAPAIRGGRAVCAEADGVNVVGFGKLRPGIAGLTCVWSSGDRIIEADIKLDKDARWAVSLEGCTLASMVEAVATHEFGHAFGLGHVSETQHGRLTMSIQLDGYCQLNEATLGLGDLLGLEARY